MATPAQIKATNEYIKKHARRFTIQCNKETDKDVIAFLEECGNVNAVVKELVRKEIKNNCS